MPFTAAPWEFPYPGPTDRPRDGAFEIYRLAARLDYHISNWIADRDRLRRRPAAQVSYESSVPYTINRAGLATAQFNTVGLDTAGMVDLNRRADRIYFPQEPRPALYAVGGVIVGRSVTSPTTVDIKIGTNAYFNVESLINYPFSESDQTQDRGDPRNEVFAVGGTINVRYNVDLGDPNIDQLYMWLEINSGVEFNVYYANMWTYWMTDVPL